MRSSPPAELREDVPPPASPPVEGRSRRGRGRLGRRLAAQAAVAVLAGAAAVGALDMYSSTHGSVGPGTVALRATWRPGGGTQVRLPPLGTVTARTHAAPVAFETRVDELDIDALQRLLGRPDPAAVLQREVAADLRPLVARFAARSALAALVLGAVVGALVPGRRWSHLVAGATGGLVAVAGLFGAAWLDFEQDAFVDPRFEGPLERAPAILRTVQRHVDSFDDVRNKIDALGKQVADLYTSAGGRAGDEDDETVILHVSDIHVNPIGLEVTRRLAESFGVDAVLDTGDLTSFGYPLEANIGDLIARIPLPYYFVPGNHDSAANRAALAGVSNVRMLHGETVTIGDVRVLGVADPTYTADNAVTPPEATAAKQQEAARVAALLRAQRPDVLAVHDPVLAERAWGRVPVVAAGHLHKKGQRLRSGTRLVTVGSTGATGLGSFTVTTDLPYEAQVLRFRDGELVAVDYVSLRGVGGSFRVDRQVVTPPEEDGTRT